MNKHDCPEWRFKHVSLQTPRLPAFARIGSRISLDMLKSMRRVNVFSTLQSLKPKNPKKTKAPKP